MLTPRSRRRFGWVWATGLVAALAGVFIVGGSGAAYALSEPIGPQSIRFAVKLVADGMGEVASGVSVAADAGVGVAEAGLAGTLVAGATGAAVVAAGLATGYAAGTVAWRLGGLVGTTLPCLDCGTASTAVVTHGCPGSPGSGAFVVASSGVFAGITIRCAYSTAGGLTFIASAAVYTYTDVVCNGVASAFSQLTIDTSWTAAGGYCSGGFEGMRLRFVDSSTNTTIIQRFSIGPTDSTSGGGAAGPTGAGLQVHGSSQCVNTSGVTAVRDALSAVFHAADPLYPAMPVPACAAGETRTGFSSEVVPLTAGSIPPVPLIVGHSMPSSSSPPAGLEFDAPCLPGGAQYPCKLSLRRVLNDQSLREYDPNVDPNPGEQTAGARDLMYRCYWGTILQPSASACEPLWQAHPKAGTVVGNAAPTPDPAPGSDTNCDGSGFSFNPVSWVIVPLKCLFIPRAAVVNAVSSGVSASWASTPPALIVGSVGKVVGPIASLSSPPAVSCQGPVFTLHFFGPDASFAPFDACSGLTAQLSAIVLPLSAVFVYVGGFWLAYRLLGSTIGLRAPGDA